MKNSTVAHPKDRLVSLTSSVCKLLEKVVVKQLSLDHCLDNRLIASQQRGFLPGRSWTTALVSATNDWLSSLDSRVSAVDLVSLNFSRAFDTISHDIIIKKLSLCYNISATALCWINSCVSDHVQRVVYKGVSYDWLSVNSGVPQGSVLGPLLFVIYANDLYPHLYCSIC